MEWREIELPWAGPLPDLDAVRRQLALAATEVDADHGLVARDHRRIVLRVRADVAERVEAALSARLPIPRPAGGPDRAAPSA